MASIPIPSYEASNVMLDALTARIRAELRSRILKSIEPDVEAALDEALKAFKATIETYREPHNMRDMVHVLIERKPAA